MSETRVVCGGCGGVNRLPPGKPAGDAKCGRCGAKLFSGEPLNVDGGQLDRQVSRGTIPILVDVWAPWCGPCRAMAPAYAAAAPALGPRVRVTKLNSEAEQAAAARLGIRSIPTMILFVSGREAARVSGALPAEQIVRWVEEQLVAAPT